MVKEQERVCTASLVVVATAIKDQMLLASGLSWRAGHRLHSTVPKKQVILDTVAEVAHVLGRNAGSHFPRVLWKLRLYAAYTTGTLGTD